MRRRSLPRPFASSSNRPGAPADPDPAGTRGPLNGPERRHLPSTTDHSTPARGPSGALPDVGGTRQPTETGRGAASVDSRVADDAHGTAEGVDGGEPLDGVDPDTAQRFASAFLSTIVTAERAADIVARLVGPVVRFGPEPVGPGG